MKSKAPIIITIVIIAAALAVVLISTNVFGLVNKQKTNEPAGTTVTGTVDEDENGTIDEEENGTVVDDENESAYEEDETAEELIHRFYGEELDTEIVNTLEVGDICHFFGGETASIPYRWFYEISDERVMGVYKDEIWSDNDPPAAPGGGDDHRMIIFEALAPGECTIMIENKYMFDDEPFSEDANIYKILVTE